MDGFRFDIMGHLMLSTMKKIQAALAELTLEQHGVDGKSLYIYGEAWDFGEVSCSLCGESLSASLLLLAGLISACRSARRHGALEKGIASVHTLSVCWHRLPSMCSRCLLLQSLLCACWGASRYHACEAW